MLLAKLGSKFCQIVNKVLKSSANILKFRQSGKISPSLVTLITTNQFVERK